MPDLGGGHKIKYNTSSSKLGSDGFNAWPITENPVPKFWVELNTRSFTSPKNYHVL